MRSAVQPYEFQSDGYKSAICKRRRARVSHRNSFRDMRRSRSEATSLKRVVPFSAPPLLAPALGYDAPPGVPPPSLREAKLIDELILTQKALKKVTNRRSRR